MSKQKRVSHNLPNLSTLSYAMDLGLTPASPITAIIGRRGMMRAPFQFLIYHRIGPPLSRVQIIAFC